MPLVTYANKTNVNPIVNRETQATAQDFNELKTSVNAIYNGVTAQSIPYKTSGGEFANSPFIYDVANNKIISSVTVEVPPGTIQVGEGLEISAAGVLQINRSRLTGIQYLNPIYEFDATGSQLPFWIEFEPETNLVVYSDDSTSTPLIGSFPTLTTANELINRIIFKTNPNATLTGVRIEVVADSTGEPIFYYPTKADWIAGTGQDIVADGTGIVSISIPETPIALLQGETLTNNYRVDSGVLLGDGVSTPYLEVDRQTGIFYNLLTEKITDATKEPTGFLIDNTTGEIDFESSEMLFDNGTRTFTIQPKLPATEFTVIQDGKLYDFNTSQNIIISDVEGLHYLYIDDGVLYETTTFDINIIYSKVFISIVYWDFTNKQQIYLAEERHGCKMDGHTHVRLHQKDGSIYLSGMTLSNFVIGDGSSDANAQFSVLGGSIKDEDIFLDKPTVSTSVGLPIFYKTGATGEWRREFNPTFSVLNTGTGRLSWNEFTGSTWQKTEVTNNDYVLYHVFATNDINYPYFSIMGQNEYSNIWSARNGASEEINNLIVDGLPFVEFVALGTIIFQTADSYSNTVKSRIITVDGENYVDWRYSGISPSGISTSDHNILLNLQGGTASEYFHLTESEHLDLTDSGDSTSHYHSSDRDRSNHTGTQTASTISDFDTEVSNNSTVVANTNKETNATHTGEVTGSGVLTVGSTAISNKTLNSSLAGTEEVLINNSGTLQKTTTQDIADLGGGGSVDWQIVFDANNVIYYYNHEIASAGSRNGHPVINFDDTTIESVICSDKISNQYSGGNITVDIDWVAATATTGAVTWGVEFERNTPGGNDIDSNSYATQQTGNSTTNATSGVITRTTIILTQTQADNVASNDYFRMRFERVPTDGSDTMSGDAQVLKITVRI